MEPISNMWADLRRSGCLNDKSSLLSNCESELQELMRQIDVMIQSKKAEWEREKLALTTRVEAKVREVQLSKNGLHQKQMEISQLREQLTNMEKQQNEIINQYESQLTTLKSEVTGMKREYEKLKKLHHRYLHKDRNKNSQESEDSVSEIRRLNSKIEDYRQKSRDWEQQRRTLMKQIDVLQTQNNTLAEKYDLLQHQSQGYQSQLDKRRDLLDSTENSLTGRITQLEGQLERSRDTVMTQETQISRLRASVDDALAAQKAALEAKDAMEKELGILQNKLQKLEDEMAQNTSALELKSEQAKLAEATTSQLSQRIQMLEEICQEKDETIATLQKMRDQSEQTDHLKDELRKAHDNISKYRKSEKQLRHEINHLSQKLDDTLDEYNQLNEELTTKLQEKLLIQEETHVAKSEASKQELSEKTSEVHQRTLALTDMNERMTSLERQFQETTETLNRRNAEVQVSNAQIEALRLENRHLRKMTLSQVQGDESLDEAEKHLQEVQSAYVASLSALEDQNKQLKEDIKKMKREHKDLNMQSLNRIQNAVREGQRVVEDVKQREKRRVEEIRSLGEQQLGIAKKKHDAMVTKYESQVKQFKNNISNLQMDIDSKNSTLKKVGLENEAMNTFVNGVEDIVSEPTKTSKNFHREALNLSGSYGSTYFSSDIHISEDEEDEEESIEAVTAQFMAEQRARTQELERKLDLHVEELKSNTAATLQKFTP